VGYFLALMIVGAVLLFIIGTWVVVSIVGLCPHDQDDEDYYEEENRE